MTRLAELASQLCSEAAGASTLAELGTLYSGLSGKSKAHFSNGNARYVTYMNVFSNPATGVSPEDRVTLADGERQNQVQAGDVLFTTSSETAAEVGMASVVMSEPPEPLYLNSFCFGWRPKDTTALDRAFAKHLFRSAGIRRQIVASANGVTRINISRKSFLAVSIPVPPLEVQRQIAAYLDPMEDLITSLEAERAARRRQLTVLRDRLLTPNSAWGSRTACLAELTESIAAGRCKSRKADGMFPVYGSTGMLGWTDVAAHTGDVLLVARVGSAGRVYAVSGTYDVSDNTLIVRPNPEWDVRFAYHQLTHANLAQYAVGGGQPLITGGFLKTLDVLVPPLPEQRRIARTLDALAALINDPASGLDAEINARAQQFTYYRDKLLAFEAQPAMETT